MAANNEKNKDSKIVLSFKNKYKIKIPIKETIQKGKAVLK